jgi:hypothetical protein
VPVRNRHRTDPEHVELSLGARMWLTVWTSFVVRPENLTEAETRTLIGLIAKVEVESLTGSGSGVDWTKFGRGELRRFEKLVEKGAGLPVGGLDNEREDRRLRAEMNEIAAKARARPLMTKKQHSDLMTVIHHHLANRHFRIGHVAVLVVVLSQFATGEPLSSMAQFRGTGDDLRLVFDVRFATPVGLVDPDGRIGNWMQVLTWLAKYRWLTVTKNGPEWAVGLGSRTRAAINGTMRLEAKKEKSEAVKNTEAEAA